MTICAAPWKSLLAQREADLCPEADMVLESGDEPHALLLDKVVAALGAPMGYAKDA